MRYLAFILFSVFLFTACQSSATQTAPGEAKRYDLKGTVISVDRERRRAKINHEEIPGYMPAMEMDFPIHEEWVWDDLVPGSDIRAQLVVDNSAEDPYWLEKIGIVANAKPGQAPPPPVNENFAQIGKEIPDFKLTNQDGKKISMKDFRGKALAITFIYAQCPLPDYCIKMSTNFSDAANRIMAEPEAKDRFR